MTENTPARTLSDLSDGERKQLRILAAVYRNPQMTGTWRKDECDRLVELGLAQQHEAWPGIFITSITPAGIEAEAALTVIRSAVDDTQAKETDDG